MAYACMCPQFIYDYTLDRTRYAVTSGNKAETAFCKENIHPYMVRPLLVPLLPADTLG
jgi:hypothetical protein